MPKYAVIVFEVNDNLRPDDAIHDDIDNIVTHSVWPDDWTYERGNVLITDEIPLSWPRCTLEK